MADDLSTVDVTAWLTRNGLDALVERFTGDCILILRHWYCNLAMGSVKWLTVLQLLSCWS